MVKNRGMQAGVSQGGLISTVHFRLFANDMPSPLHHIQLPIHVQDMAIIATSCKLVLFTSYLEA
jgi:hypothetical protein